MSQYAIYSTYKNQIERWCKSISEGLPPDEYFSQFFASVREQTNLNVTYDIKIVQCLKFFLLYIKYSKVTSEQIIAISNELYRSKFMTFRDFKQIEDLKDKYIDDLAKIYIETAKDILCQSSAEDRPSKVNFVWESTFPISLNIFWQLILSFNIICPSLYLLEEITFQVDEIDNKKEIHKHLQSLRHTTDNTVTELSRQMRKMKLQDQQPQKQKIKILQENNSGSNRSQIQKDNARKEERQQLQKLYLQTFIREQDSRSKYLQKVAIEHSLFFNPDNRQLVNNIFSFIQSIKTQFQFDEEFTIDLFGSLRSKLAIKDEYDIDLTYVSKFNTITKEEGLEKLHLYLNKIAYMNLCWIQYGEVISIRDAKMPPYLKLHIDRTRFFDVFQIDIDKLDFTACNNSAIINSQFLSYFSKNQQVGLLCIIIKMWAKKYNVINKRYPMQGLSAYGVIMMCLYYLMKTGQINFLQFSSTQLNNITIGSLVPQLKFYRKYSFYENLTGFFDYYRKDGIYLSEKTIICLLKNSEQGLRKYDPQLVYNMYDFMDRTNPGRLSMKKFRLAAQNVVNTFSRAYYIMKEGNIHQIKRLLEN